MLLGFKREFAVPIKEGTKVFTMRFPRKRPAQIGETLHMYSDLCTNKCSLISKKFKLVSIQKVSITIVPTESGNMGFGMTIDGKKFNGDMDDFAKMDGFPNRIHFYCYWLDGKNRVTHNLDLYHWTDLRF